MAGMFGWVPDYCLFGDFVVPYGYACVYVGAERLGGILGPMLCRTAFGRISLRVLFVSSLVLVEFGPVGSVAWDVFPS